MPVNTNSEEITSEDKELLAREKKPEELIAPVWGRVTYVDSESIPSSLTTDNGIIGPEYYSHTIRTGDSNRLEIGLTNQIVRKIIFHGNSPVVAGNYIKAYVLKGAWKDLKTPILPSGPAASWRDEDIKRKVLVEGELRTEMSALYIEIMLDEKVIRTDCGVHYDGENKRIVF
ncbi:hypothetical protein HYT23_06305 [Candidatus Pacearchaeota archaeon]|nr:hypothetical protein [Candidatus Pacearchaeota archaeon]